MRELTFLGVRFLDGGLLVALFALIGTVLRPKRLAGLFSAAPSVALAGLLVEVVQKGDRSAAIEASSMVGGALALAAYCLVARFILRPLGALPGSAIAMGVWFAVAAILYWSGLR